MKILVIGSTSSIYIYTYIKEILSISNSITIINQFYSEANHRYDDFYESNHIKIIYLQNIKVFANSVTDYVHCISQLGEFDVCHVHWLGEEACLAVALCSKQFKNIIANYWGSDLLRASRKMIEAQSYLLDAANHIVVDAQELVERLEYIFAGKYNAKLRVIRFTPPLLDCLNEVKRLNHHHKIVVVCGYNGHTAQQHRVMIDAIKKCGKSVWDKIIAVFPMTYGATAEYIQDIETQLADQPFEYKLLKGYLSDEEIALLRMNTDVLIHIQTTDALASSIIETFFCEGILINGEWLNYKELEEYDLVYYNVKIDELSDMLSKTVLENEAIKSEVSLNKKKIMQFINKNNEIKWKKIYMDTAEREYDLANVNSFCLDYIDAKLKGKMEEETLYRLLYKKLDLKINLVHWFKERKDTKIVIYGMGKWGRLFYTELFKDLKSEPYNINIYYYDKNIIEDSGLERIKLEDLKRMGIDRIIITPLKVYSEIIENVEKYIEKSKVVCITDILEL